MQNLLSIFQGPTFATVLLGVAWMRATQWGGLGGLVGGVIVSSSLFAAGMNFLYVAWWSFCASLLINIIISLLTRPEPLEKIQGLVYGLVVKEKTNQDTIEKRANS